MTQAAGETLRRGIYLTCYSASRSAPPLLKFAPPPPTTTNSVSPLDCTIIITTASPALATQPALTKMDASAIASNDVHDRRRASRGRAARGAPRRSSSHICAARLAPRSRLPGACAAAPRRAAREDAPLGSAPGHLGLVVEVLIQRVLIL